MSEIGRCKNVNQHRIYYVYCVYSITFTRRSSGVRMNEKLYQKMTQLPLTTLLEVQEGHVYFLPTEFLVFRPLDEVIRAMSVHPHTFCS